MLQARPSSPDDSEEFDDVFDDSLLIPASAKKKQCLSKSRSLKTSYDSYLTKEMIHPLNDLNKSLDGDETQEPYKRRGSEARLEKRRPSNKPSSFVTFAEILSHFQNQDPMKMQRILAEQNAKHGNGKILGIFSPHPRLSANLSNEKDIFLLMAETKYERTEPIHLLILQSIYSRLMGGPLTCPALGAHWMDVGFNHPDPSIDLTSAKMLGAVSLLFFITQYPALAEDVFQLSTSSYQGFPFALVGLNFTRSIVRLVRKEILNRHFIRQKQLIYIVMDLYCAVWYKFYVSWKNNDPNIRDLNSVTTAMEHDIIVKPLSILAQFQKGIKRTNSNPGGNTVGFKTSFIKRGLKFSSSSSNINIRSVFSQS